MTKGILSLIRKLFIFISGMWEVGADDFRQKYNRKGYPQTTSGIPGGCGELGRQRCLGTLLQDLQRHIVSHQKFYAAIGKSLNSPYLPLVGSQHGGAS